MTESPATDEPSTSAKVAKATGRTAKALGKATFVTAKGLGRFSRFAFVSARRAADAEGARESGLSRLLIMHACNNAGDAAVAISLAGSLFFSVPTGGSGSSREHVALFLGLTMLPFAIVAPLLGPFLDRIAHGRRWAIGATMALRAFLCWVLAGALPHGSASMYPAVLGVLVASKAYGVTKAAAVPRLLPETFTLVKGNGRVSMAGIVGVCFSAPIAGLASLAGPEWVLRWGAVVFVLATIGAIRLPGRVDSNRGEGSLTLGGSGEPATGRRGQVRMHMPATVSYAIRANCAPKWLYGFLLMFMAFLLQTHPIHGWKPTILLALVAGGAGAGNFIGVVAASLLKSINPRVTVTAVVIVDAVAAGLCAFFYGVVALVVIGLVAGLGQALAKFALDSTIQQDVPPSVQTAAFARSDTTLQLAWVVGGFVGIALPLHAELGLWVACAVLAAWGVLVVSRRRPAVARTDQNGWTA